MSNYQEPNEWTRYAVDTQEEWRPNGQYTKVTYHVIDTEDNDREIAVFPEGMRTEADDLMVYLNEGGPEPTDRAGREQWRDYTRNQY